MILWDLFLGKYYYKLYYSISTVYIQIFYKNNSFYFFLIEILKIIKYIFKKVYK